MSAAPSLRADLAAAPAPHFHEAHDASVLARIREEGVNLVLWHRGPQPAVRDLLEALAQKGASLAIDACFSSPAEIPAALAAAPALRPVQRDSACAQLTDDLQRLVAVFSSLTGSATVRLRLTTVRDDACAAFHADTLTLRLLCTYRGKGTQWLENRHVQRDQLGLRGRSTAEANAAIALDPRHIRTIPAWTVAVLKGRAFPGEAENALIHRSHPVCCAEHARVRLCLDAAA